MMLTWSVRAQKLVHQPSSEKLECSQWSLLELIYIQEDIPVAWAQIL